MPKFRRAYRIGFFFLFLCLLLLIALFAYSDIPRPMIVTDTVGDASIRFEVNDHIILSDTACYTVQWQVSGIEGVYLNDSGKIGEGQERLCYDEIRVPELRVHFEDGSSNTYTLEIIFLQQEPSFWAFVAIAVLLFVFGIYFFILPFIGLTLRTTRQLRYSLINLLALIIFTILVVGGLLEIGLRFYFINFGTENDRINYIYNSEEIQATNSRQTGAPYVKFLNNPNYIGHNDLGFRGDSTTIEKPEGTYRIMTIGSSTTYGFGINASQAYPTILEEELQEEYGYTNVEVINAGVIGYTSYETLADFQFRLLEYSPDLIIYYGAKGDLETRYEDPGCFNNPSPLYGLPTYHGMWRTEFADLPDSALFRFFAINTDMMQEPTSPDFSFTSIPLEEVCDSGERYTNEELLELNSAQFIKRNIRNLVGMAKFNDVEVMISEFIHPTTLEQVDGDENLLMSPSEEQAIAEINEFYRELADEQDIYYYPLSDDFVIESGDFWTTSHLRSNGADKQAQLYAKYIHESNIIPIASDAD